MKKINKILIISCMVLTIFIFTYSVKASNLITKEDLFKRVYFETEMPADLYKEISKHQYFNEDYYYIFAEYLINGDITDFQFKFIPKSSNVKFYINYIDAYETQINMQLKMSSSTSIGECKISYNNSTKKWTITNYLNQQSNIRYITLYLNSSTYNNITGKYKGILYSNITLYDDNSYTDFFLRTGMEYQIPMITEVGTLPQTIVEVLKIVTPIGLLVFGMGLVIYLIRWVISRVQ